ncbi:DNA endonuclease SmrA [Gayadomonas joobiniege]|uniref:DNA endonuclease SmrA n=1 Tax=Gayadomonas joobiniege TaxID=1234606 RepID=UPI0003679AC0|nr:DNA endonuclease SmrA [Gayadomonas joobiniege]
MMNDDDKDALFMAAFADVKPIKQDTIATPKHQIDEAARLRKEALTLTSQLEHNQLTTGYVPAIDPLDMLMYKKDGVQNEVFKKLRAGKYPVAAHLNISHMSIEQARLAVFKYINQSREKNHRCVLIKHGLKHVKGSPDLFLKSYVNTWLPQLESVLAVHSAPKHLGGYASCLVLLKKSDEQKRETRERMQKRCG